MLHSFIKKACVFICALLCICFLPISIKAATINASKNTTVNYRKTVFIGDSFVFKKGYSSKGYTYSSANKKIAKVSKNGKVTTVSGGKTVITCKKGKKIYTTTLTVNNSVDMILFAGQSNMMGHGDASEAPKLSKNAGFAYNPITSPQKFLPIKEPFCYGQDKTGYFENGSLATGSMVTSFANAYYKSAKKPIIAVPCSSAGTGSFSWVQFRYKEVIRRAKAAKKLAKKKGLSIDHIFIVWMQGENDAFAMQGDMTPGIHQDNLKKLYKQIDKDITIDKFMIVGLPSYYNDLTIGGYYKRIRKAQKSLCQKSSKFEYISNCAESLGPEFLLEDGLHLNQKALNKVGTQAGKNAAKFAKQKTPSKQEGTPAISGNSFPLSY